MDAQSPTIVPHTMTDREERPGSTNDRRARQQPTVILYYKKTEVCSKDEQPRLDCAELHKDRHLVISSSKPHVEMQNAEYDAVALGHEYAMVNWHHLEPLIMSYRKNKSGGLNLCVGHGDKSLKHAKMLLKSLGYDMSRVSDVRFFFKRNLLSYFENVPCSTHPSRLFPNKYDKSRPTESRYRASLEWNRLTTKILHRLCKTECACCRSASEMTQPCDSERHSQQNCCVDYQNRHEIISRLCKSIFGCGEDKRVWHSFSNDDGANVRVKTYEPQKIEAICVPACQCRCARCVEGEPSACEHARDVNHVECVLESLFGSCLDKKEPHQHYRPTPTVPAVTCSTGKDELWKKSSYECLSRVVQNMVRVESCDTSCDTDVKYFTKKQHHVIGHVPLCVMNLMIECWQWHMGVVARDGSYYVLNGNTCENAKFCDVLWSVYPQTESKRIEKFHNRFGNVHCYNASELGLLCAIVSKWKRFAKIVAQCLPFLKYCKEETAFKMMDDRDDENYRAFDAVRLSDDTLNKYCRTEHERIFLTMACIELTKLSLNAVLRDCDILPQRTDSADERLGFIEHFLTTLSSKKTKDRSQHSMEDCKEECRRMKKLFERLCKQRKQSLLWLVNLPDSSWYEYSKHNLENTESMLKWLSACRTKTVPPHMIYTTLLSINASMM